MALNIELLEIEQLFDHAKRTSTGIGHERVGQETVIVSNDDTGDTNDLQEAVDMIGKNGGAIFIKEGTYKIEERISITEDNIRISGTGRGTEIKFIASSYDYIFDIRGNYCEIRDILITGNSYCDGGVLVYANDHTRITNCYIESNYFGIEIDTASDIIITNNTISSGDSSGIFTSGATGNNIISNNIIHSNNDEGIYIDGENTIITGNTIYSNGGNGIEVAGNSMVIEGNYLNDNGGRGINIRGGISYCTISNNRVRNSTSDDIYITNASSTSNIIVANQVSGTDAGTITDNGTDTQIGHNITTEEV